VPRLLVILAAAAVLYLLLRRIAAMPPHLRRGEYLKLGTGVAVVAVIILTLTGKMHWIGAALTGLLVALRQTLPLLLRLFPMLGQLGQQTRAGPRQSTVSTRTLRMHLDHDTGALSGEVIDGPFRDWRLEEMDRGQLDELRGFCEREDPESLQLLDGYLEQRFGDAQEQQGGRTEESVAAGGGMSRQEALEVLGLDETADRAAIVEAHRKLMQKLHPDRGGSDYLAAKINQAKDLLLSTEAAAGSQDRSGR
jgi:hypothetical protein